MYLAFSEVESACHRWANCVNQLLAVVPPSSLLLARFFFGRGAGDGTGGVGDDSDGADSPDGLEGPDDSDAPPVAAARYALPAAEA